MLEILPNEKLAENFPAELDWSIIRDLNKVPIHIFREAQCLQMVICIKLCNFPQETFWTKHDDHNQSNFQEIINYSVSSSVPTSIHVIC